MNKLGNKTTPLESDFLTGKKKYPSRISKLLNLLILFFSLHAKRKQKHINITDK